MSDITKNLLIDGHWGEPHVSAQQIADYNAAMTSFNDVVFNVGNALNAEVESSNLIKSLMAYGRFRDEEE